MKSSAPVNSVAVIGAGIAGVSCALGLRRAGPAVTVFEQASFPGGRMASKTCGEFGFDCGAQYFTVRSDVFRDQVKRWQEQWLVDEWPAWLVDLQDGEALSHQDGVTRYIGRPVMHSVIEDMAEFCDVRYDVAIGKVKRDKRSGQWELFDRRGAGQGIFDAVIVAVPAPQAVPLLQQAPVLAKAAAGVTMLPCWAVMLAFEQPLQMGFDGAYVVGDTLSWIVRDSGKVERDNRRGMETWVLHAGPEWSLANRKLAEKKVIARLLEYLARVTGRSLPAPAFAAAELWPYARPLNPLPAGSLYNTELRIGACGDWCYGARVEGAYLSGLAVAGRVLHG